MKTETINKIYLSKSVWGQVSHLARTLAQSKEQLSKKRVIICEEKFTMTVEKTLSRALGGIMTTRVLSFGKICDTLKSTEKYLSKTSETMLLAKVTRELSSELELFGAVSKNPSFANSIYEILSLISSSHVDFNSLSKSNLPPALSKKISDICKIESRYKAEKEGLFLDATDKMQALYQSFENVEVLKNAEIFIVGHTAFTNQMLAVISKMIKACDVTIYLLKNSVATISSLKNVFSSIEEKFAPVEIAEQFSPLQTGIMRTIKGENTQNTLENLNLLQFSCEEYEAENIALKILHQLQAGVMPEDISLTIANFDSGLDRFIAMFEKYNIPYFASRTRTLDDFPFPQHILNLLDLAISNFSLDSVRRVLKSPFSPLSKEDSFTFENFLIARNVDRGRFFKDEIFANAGMLDFRDRFLVDTNIFKAQAIFAEDFGVACEILATKNLDTLALMQCDITGLGKIDTADFLSLSIKKTFEVIAEMELVLQYEFYTLENIKSIFEGGLCGKEISTIPSAVHAVEICDIAKSTLSLKKHAYITTASKSYFPGYQKDTAILSDKDILSLSLENINISPSVEFLNENQDLLCELVLFSGTDSLTISYSEIIAGGKETASELFSCLMGVSPCTYLESQYHFALEKTALTLEEGVSSKENANLIAEVILSDTIFDKTQAIAVFARETTKENIIAKEISSGIYSAFQSLGETATLDAIAKRSHTEYVSCNIARKEYSPSHIERYFACPYACFLAQNIRLSDREVGVLKEFDTGNFLHNLLEEFSRNMHELSQDEITKEVARISAKLQYSPAFSKFTNQEKFQFVFSRLSREADKICKHIYKSTEISNFKPTMHEFTFGGTRPVITPDGLSLMGKVDRVDIYASNAVVVDYKTGHIDLSDGAFYHGLKLQSELYLYAVSKLTNKQPCGCVYLPISDDYKAFPPSYKMKGKLLNDKTVLQNLDWQLAPEQSSEIYPIQINKNGTYRANPSLLEKDQFEKHLQDAIKTANQGRLEIERGYIFPSPYRDGNKDSCTYCRYSSICKTCGEDNMRGGKLKKEEQD